MGRTAQPACHPDVHRDDSAAGRNAADGPRSSSPGPGPGPGRSGYLNPIHRCWGTTAVSRWRMTPDREAARGSCLMLVNEPQPLGLRVDWSLVTRVVDRLIPEDDYPSAIPASPRPAGHDRAYGRAPGSCRTTGASWLGGGSGACWRTACARAVRSAGAGRDRPRDDLSGRTAVRVGTGGDQHRDLLRSLK